MTQGMGKGCEVDMLFGSVTKKDVLDLGEGTSSSMGQKRSGSISIASSSSRTALSTISLRSSTLASPSPAPSTEPPNFNSVATTNTPTLYSKVNETSTALSLSSTSNISTPQSHDPSLHHTSPPSSSNSISSSASLHHSSQPSPAPPSKQDGFPLQLFDTPPSLLAVTSIPGVSFSSALRPPKNARTPNIPKALSQPISSPTAVETFPKSKDYSSSPTTPVSTGSTLLQSQKQQNRPAASWAELVKRQQIAPVDIDTISKDARVNGSSVRSPTASSSGLKSPSANGVVPFSVSANGFTEQGNVVQVKPQSLESQLEGVEKSSSAPIFYPRGLINNGNLCFANAILQVLVYCPPFYNLMQILGRATAMDFGRRTPTMDAMVVFLQEFKPISKGEIAQSRSKARIDGSNKTMSTTTFASAKDDAFLLFPPTTPEWTEPFIPEIVYESMKGNKRFDAMRRGTQEDAQEFLGFFLDTLHEEILLAVEIHDKPWHVAKGEENGEIEIGDKGGEEEEWMEVGAKGKTAFTRTMEAKESPITRIFGGKLRSVVRCPGQKDSVTLEPYLTLQLDIQPEKVFTIYDALLNFQEPEIISGLTNVKGVKVDGIKQVFIETLPPILVLHLKRFLYDKEGGVMKSGKVIGYDADLEIPISLLSPARKSKVPPKYKLFGVVYHHGRSAAGGHYTAAVRQPASPYHWINIDDTFVRSVDVNEVAIKQDQKSRYLNEDKWGTTEKNAYLLFYHRVA